MSRKRDGHPMPHEANVRAPAAPPLSADVSCRAAAARLAVLLTAALLPAASAAHGQQVETEPLRELVAVLLNTTPDNLLLGRMAEGAPFGEEITAGMRIVGSISRGTTGGSVVLAMMGDPQDAEARLRDRLLESGWTAPAQQRGFGGGFVSTAGPGPTMLCREDVFASVFSPATAGPPGGSYVNITWSRAEGGIGPCAIDRMRPPPGYVNPLPELQPPPGVLVRGSGTGGGGGPMGFRSDAVLLTGRPLPPIFEHYARELERHGFTLGELESADFAANQPFTWSDDDSRPWEGELLLARGRQGRNPVIHATLRMRQVGG